MYRKWRTRLTERRKIRAVAAAMQTLHRSFLIKRVKLQYKALDLLVYLFIDDYELGVLLQVQDHEYKWVK